MATKQEQEKIWGAHTKRTTVIEDRPAGPPGAARITVQQVVDGLSRAFTEHITSGGSYVNAANRIMLMGLAMTLEAKDILETGYNTGLTTYALAMSGARVVGIDNYFESSGLEDAADIRLQELENVTLIREDALVYLIGQENNRFDMVFIDDCHWPEYTRQECVEIKRILRPGGVAVFHDTFYAEIWDVIEDAFPRDWQRINLPSMQPALESTQKYSGVKTMRGVDLGLGIIRKPFVHTKHPLSREVCFTMGTPPELNLGLTINDKEIMRGPWGETEEEVVQAFIAMLRLGRENPILGRVVEDNSQTMAMVLRNYGAFCSELASHVGKMRYHQPQDPPQNDESTDDA